MTRSLPGITISSASDAVRSLLALRRMGGGGRIPVTVITSCELRVLETPAPSAPLLHLFAMWGQDEIVGGESVAAGGVSVCSIEIDKIDAALTGISAKPRPYLPPANNARHTNLLIRHRRRVLFYIYRLGRAARRAASG